MKIAPFSQSAPRGNPWEDEVGDEALPWRPSTYYTALIILTGKARWNQLVEHRKRTVFLFFCLFFVFLPFLGPLPRHMEVRRLGV